MRVRARQELRLTLRRKEVPSAMGLLRRAFIMLPALLILANVGGGEEAFSAPVQTLSSSQRITMKTRRVSGSGVLKDGLKADVGSSALQWDYIPGTSVSVPFITLRLTNVPANSTVLAARSGKLPPDKDGHFSMRFPIVKQVNPLLFTVIDATGRFEEWEVVLSLALLESAVFVDENCREYALKIRELKRPKGPNLVYIGCRAGGRPQELSLDVLWNDVDRVEYMSKAIPSNSSVVTLPLESRRQTETKLSGFHPQGQQSIYAINYQPFVPPPYEAWVGLAFFKTSFEQSNFKSKYGQTSTAFLSQFWYHPGNMSSPSCPSWCGCSAPS